MKHCAKYSTGTAQYSKGSTASGLSYTDVKSTSIFALNSQLCLEVGVRR